LIRALPARAKVNLELRVVGRRGDGHHEVDTLVQAVSLHDLLELEPAPESSLEVTGLRVPLGADNLVSRALAAAGATARVKLTKRIPPGSGLGGGSSDAAAVLRLFDAGDKAPNLGADVTFFLRGGTARATGRGERLEQLPDRPGWFALAWPGIELSTASVYRAWDRVGGEGRNELFQAAASVEPALQDFAQKLGEGWVMTGSGSAFFREFGDPDSAGAAVAGLDCWTAVARAVGCWA